MSSFFLVLVVMLPRLQPQTVYLIFWVSVKHRLHRTTKISWLIKTTWVNDKSLVSEGCPYCNRCDSRYTITPQCTMLIKYILISTNLFFKVDVIIFTSQPCSSCAYLPSISTHLRFGMSVIRCYQRFPQHFYLLRSDSSIAATAQTIYKQLLQQVVVPTPISTSALFTHKP